MASTLGTLRQYLPELTAPPACRYPAVRCAQANIRERRTVEVSSGVEATAMAQATTDLAAAAASEFADLERLWYEMDWPPGSRIELIDGELVVSPTGSVWHSAAVEELQRLKR
jgi:hypothetical protein